MSQRQMNILGIDEAGRGAFAGPLVVAGVLITVEKEQMLRKTTAIIRDSKKMSEKQRDETFQTLQHLNIPTSVSIISIEEINQFGIGWANYKGIKQVAKSVLSEEIIVDGRFPMDKIFVPGVSLRCQVDADATELPVILAGIVAKVTRDRIMKQLDQEFPVYQWKQNKGYGTLLHRQKIEQHGICTHHRKSFIH